MEKKKKGNREPYRPEDTPQPPQQMDPGGRAKDRTERQNSPDKRAGETTDPAPGKHHLLSDQADIDDETTV
ncbi:MAG TPA: hypothetical protein VF490_09125 [Chryseosolibacter sp.]